VPTSDNDWTYRPRSAVPAFAGTAVVAIGLALAQAADGGVRALLEALPFALAGILAGWLVFAKPYVRVADDGIHVVNPVASYHVPWAALILVKTRFACTFVTPHREVQAFAAPGPGRYTAATATVVDLRATGRNPKVGADLGELPIGASGQVATVVHRRWKALVESGALELGEAEDTPVARHLDVPALAALVALLALGVVLQLVR
jgi:hypothetical protein